MMRIIDRDTWPRKEHFEWFSAFDEPFFSLMSDVDCTTAFMESKGGGPTFFARYLHACLTAINTISEFRYRVVEDQVVEFDAIHASPTLGREDGTFGFGFVRYDADLTVFNTALNKDVQRVQSFSGLGVNENSIRQDVIHFSAIPWVKFTALTHARSFKFQDSAPKITVGKVYQKEDRFLLPTSVTVHHGFLDGFHVGEFLKLFEEQLNR